jgi:hypothetical protein
MALAFDNANIDSGWVTSASSSSYSHTVSSGSDRILLAGFSTFHSGALVTVSSATWQGAALTPLASITAGVEGYTQSVELWYIIAPAAAGPGTIAYSLSGTCDFFDSCSASYTGVHQTTPFGIPATNQNTSAATSHSLGVTTVSDNSWLVGYVFSRGSSIVAGAGTTLRGLNNGSGTSLADTNGAKTPVGAYTLAYTAASGTWPGAITVELLDVAGSLPGQFARPTADISDGGWLNQSGSGTNLYDSINEVTVDDADWIQSGSNPANDATEIQLGPLDMSGAGTWTLRYRARRV